MPIGAHLHLVAIGKRTMKAAEDRSQHTSLRVVALTALAMKCDHQRLLSAGFDGYLAKPLDIRRFPGQVRQFCAASDR